MKKYLLLVGCAALVAGSAGATEKGTVGLGVDFAQPYSVNVDATGADDTQRDNVNLGLDARYYMTETMNWGVRFSFDLEDNDHLASTNKIQLAPGFQYRWMASETWHPYTRLDLPVTLRGAPNATQDDNKTDVGFGAGAGIAWDLGKALDVQNLVVRYDFDITYMFGVSDAIALTTLDLFKIGFDYHF